MTYVPYDADRAGTFRDLGGDVAEIRFERQLAHPIEKVWAALSVPDRLIAWFAQMDPNVAVGETFAVHFPHAPQYKSQGVLTALEPGRVIEWEWDDSGRVRFELEPDGPEGRATRLILTHRTPLRSQAGDFGSGWHIHLHALDQFLDSGKVDEIRQDKVLQGWYEQRFGL